jgi:hypothetical protein
MGQEPITGNAAAKKRRMTSEKPPADQIDRSEKHNANDVLKTLSNSGVYQL